MAKKRKLAVTGPIKKTAPPAKVRKTENIAAQKDRPNSQKSNHTSKKDSCVKNKLSSTNAVGKQSNRKKYADIEKARIKQQIGSSKNLSSTKSMTDQVQQSCAAETSKTQPKETQQSVAPKSTQVALESLKRKKQGSCMKHKKKDKTPGWKKKHKKWKKNKGQTDQKDILKGGEKGVRKKDNTEKSCTKKDEERIVLPSTPQDISANWKALQKVCHLGKKRKHHVHDEIHLKKTPLSPQHSSKEEIWFDDVDEVLIQSSRTKSTGQMTKTREWNSSVNPLVKSDAYSGITKAVAIDCEMVGVGSGGQDSVLARVSVVNQYGQCIYDKMVKARETVVDYRTPFSGIRPGDLDDGEEFADVQKEVHDIIKGRILVGHALHNDLKVLFLDHPHKKIRDTSRYKPFRKVFQGRIPSLKKLSDQILGVQVQQGEHNSIQDAQAAMRLYTMYRKTWEKEIELNRPHQGIADKFHRTQIKSKTPSQKSDISETLKTRSIMDSESD